MTDKKKINIPLSVPNFVGNEAKYVEKAVMEGWVSTGGAFIMQLEKELTGYLNVEEVVACQSGTAGIHLALLECGVGPGDSVIVPTLTFIAAVNPVRYQYAAPIFMDCDDSLCMDPEKLLRFCEEECEHTGEGLLYRKTGSPVKAVLVVHVFGNAADMESIMEIAEKYKLKVIEDATEALGTVYLSGKYKGKMAGTIGDFGVYSFNGNKIITTGGGGAVVAKNRESSRHIRYISQQAKDDSLFYIHHEIGYNYRMTNLQAALGVAQLESLPDFIQRKHNNYESYRKHFERCEVVRLLPFRQGIDSNQWFYGLEIDLEHISFTLEEIIKELQEIGIQTRPIWGLIHEQLPYTGFLAYQIEKAEYYQKRIINLPCSTNLTEDEIVTVASEIIHLLEDHKI